MKTAKAKATRPTWKIDAHCDLDGRLHTVEMQNDTGRGRRVVLARNLTGDETRALLEALKPILDRICL